MEKDFLQECLQDGGNHGVQVPHPTHLFKLLHIVGHRPEPIVEKRKMNVHLLDDLVREKVTAFIVDVFRALITQGKRLVPRKGFLDLFKREFVELGQCSMGGAQRGNLDLKRVYVLSRFVGVDAYGC